MIKMISIVKMFVCYTHFFFRAQDIQDYLVPEVTLVFLDPKGFQGLRAPQVLVFQALWGHLDLKEIRDILAPQEFLDGQALQVRLDLIQTPFPILSHVSWAQKACCISVTR